MNENNTARKLPLVKIFRESLYLIKNKFNIFIRIGMPLFVIMFFSSFVSKYGFAGQSIILSLLFMIIVLVIVVIVLVGCHRIFLLSDDKVINMNAIRWGDSETKFIGWWLAIGVIVMILLLPIMFFVFPILINTNNNITKVIPFLNIPVYYFISRWSLVLPATAVEDADASLSYAWKLSIDNGWRLTILISGIPLVTSLIFGLLPIFDSVFYLLVANFIWLMVALFEVGLLSISYAYLKGGVSNINQEVKA